MKAQIFLGLPVYPNAKMYLAVGIRDNDGGGKKNKKEPGPTPGRILKRGMVLAGTVEAGEGGPIDIPADFIAGGVIIGTLVYAEVVNLTDDAENDNISNLPPPAGKITDAPIYIPPEYKIDRDLLNPPDRAGNAPTFKKDGTPVEIHHEGQSATGPYKEMHWRDHRGKGNDKANHPKKGDPSEIDRKSYDKLRREYWKNEYFPPDELPIT